MKNVLHFVPAPHNEYDYRGVSSWFFGSTDAPGSASVAICVLVFEYDGRITRLALYPVDADGRKVGERSLSSVPCTAPTREAILRCVRLAGLVHPSDAERLDEKTFFEKSELALALTDSKPYICTASSSKAFNDQPTESNAMDSNTTDNATSRIARFTSDAGQVSYWRHTPKVWERMTKKQFEEALTGGATEVVYQKISQLKGAAPTPVTEAPIEQPVVEVEEDEEHEDDADERRLLEEENEDMHEDDLDEMAGRD